MEDCLVTTDGYQPYTRVMRELLGDTCVYTYCISPFDPDCLT